MSQPNMKDNMDKFLFKWSNLTSLGVPSSTIGAVLDNEQVYKHSPSRFNFYMQVMESIANPNPRILETVIKKENQTRFQREQIDDKIKNIVQYFQRPEAKMDSNLLQTIKGKLSGNILTRNIKVEETAPRIMISEQKVTAILNTFITNYKLDTTPHTFTPLAGDTVVTSVTKLEEYLLKNFGSGTYEFKYWDRVLKALEYPVKETINEVRKISQEAIKYYSTDPAPTPLVPTTPASDARKKWFEEQAEFWKKFGSVTGGAIPEMSGRTLLSDMSNRLFDQKDGNEGITEKFKSLSEATPPTPEQVISTYKNDPYYSPTNEKVEWADRAIFIGITYIVRALALFLTEWSIYSGYIKKFTDAFAMYFGMYTCIFLLVVFLTNARKEDMIFRMIFFYMNSQSDDGKGIWRIVVHLICILMLLPIPYVVKEYREFDQPPVLSFADKATILSGVEKFSMYTWLLTSVVALNV